MCVGCMADGNRKTQTKETNQPKKKKKNKENLFLLFAWIIIYVYVLNENFCVWKLGWLYEHNVGYTVIIKPLRFSRFHQKYSGSYILQQGYEIQLYIIRFSRHRIEHNVNMMYFYIYI